MLFTRMYSIKCNEYTPKNVEVIYIISTMNHVVCLSFNHAGYLNRSVNCSFIFIFPSCVYCFESLIIIVLLLL